MISSKFSFSLRTFYKELIWCANDPAVHIYAFCKRWKNNVGGSVNQKNKCRLSLTLILRGFILFRLHFHYFIDYKKYLTLLFRQNRFDESTQSYRVFKIFCDNVVAYRSTCFTLMFHLYTIWNDKKSFSLTIDNIF